MSQNLRQPVEKSVPVSRPIDWWVPVMGPREKARVCEVIDRGFPNDGEYTLEFEKKVADLLRAPYAVAATSGTAAMFLALAAGGVGPGDEVLVPDITFIATANAVSLAGAKPVLVDVRVEDFCMDPARAARAVTARTKAMIVVHVSGRSAPLAELLALAKERSLFVVEDAAEAFGSRSGSMSLGNFGDAGCFSFTANKTITTGQGGMVITKDPAVERRLRELKDHGRRKRGTGGADEHPALGYNFKFTNLQAAMGLAQLEDFPRRHEHLTRIYGIYHGCLSGHPRLRLPGFRVEDGECPQWVDAFVDDRDGLHDFLLARGIQTRKFWFPLHSQPPYRGSDQAYPAAVDVSRHALWLPSAFTLTEEDVRYVCAAILEWMGRN